ncbi:hypothetical protein [Catellatospora methionotrophica]|uniref:hypothetical protein n=1 Tax=Catellatospora methionotrophica TaxID=121620 RepID=UPI00340C984E
MFVETETVALRNTVVLPFVNAAFDAAGAPVNPAADVSMKIMLDDLAWWSRILERARAEGELIPGLMRARAAMAKA